MPRPAPTAGPPTTNRRATVARTDRRSHRVNSIETSEANRRVEPVSTEADGRTGSRFMGSWGSWVGFKVQEFGSGVGFQEFVERLTPAAERNRAERWMRLAALQPEIAPAWQKDDVRGGLAGESHPGLAIAEPEIERIVDRAAAPFRSRGDRARVQRDGLAAGAEHLDVLAGDRHAEHVAAERASDRDAAPVGTSSQAGGGIAGDAAKQRVRTR